MVTTTKNIITKEQLERYLPNPLRRVGKEHRTWIGDSKSRTHLSIDFEGQHYYDFHTNQGGGLVSLARQLGMPIPREIAESNPLLTYIKQLARLARFKNEGRYFRCGMRTAEKTNLRTGLVERAQRIMCLRWDCFKCAEFLKRVYMEHFVDYHCGAIYLVPKRYRGIGEALNRIKQKARRAGIVFEWWLLQSNDYQILFVDSRSDQRIKDWLAKEPYFELEAFMPNIDERNYWMEKGLERMDNPMAWNHKVRHSRGILSLKACVDNVTNTHNENITLSTSTRDKFLQLTQAEHKELVKNGQVQRIEDGKTITYFCLKVDRDAFFGYQWNSLDKTLEERVTELESQGYTADWLSEDIVRFIPPRGGSP